MKQMLITGGSKGIGKGIAEYFSDSYEIITVARDKNSGVTEIGDLSNPSFVDMLVEKYRPDVFINNAGIVVEDTSMANLELINEINFSAAVKLLQGFYIKMDGGNIINIGSQAAELQGYVTNMNKFSYMYTKAGLHKASHLISQSGERNNKVTLINLGSVKTTIRNRFYGIKIPDEEYIEQTWRTIPMLTSDVAKTIHWILTLPSHLAIHEIELTNHVNPDGKAGSKGEFGGMKK